MARTNARPNPPEGDRDGHFRSLVKNIPGAVYRCSYDQDWTAVYFSDNIRDITGYPASDFIGNKVRSYSSLIHPEDMPMVDKAITQALRKKEPFVIEYRVYCKNGLIRWVHEKGQGISDAQGKMSWIDGIILEITEHKQMEQALQNREERFRTLVENIPGAVYRCACDKEWTIEFLSENICDITGYPPSDFIGNKVRSYASIIYADDVEMVERVVLEHVKKREPYDLEYRIVRKDGSICWIYERGRGVYDAQGKVSWLDGVVMDITEHKRVELETKQWLGLLDATRDGIFIFDPESLRFSYVNQGAIDQTGYSRAELLTMTPLDIKSEFTEQRFRQMIAPMVAGELSTHSFSAVHRRKDGSDVQVEVILQIVAPMGGPRNFVALVRDITERKRGEEALKESERELKKQKLVLEQKNVALQEILGQIEIEKKQIKESIVANAEELLLPALRKLRRKGSALDKKHIDLLEKNVLQLTSGFGAHVSERRWRLTPREIEICNMIKSGLSSKEIAELINLSFRTIEIHRNNIRKKMGLARKKINLTTYLQSF